MFGFVFGHGLIKKYVIYFGTLFNELYVNREKDGEVYQSLRVPISYGPKEKFLARLEGDPRFERPAMVLPRMAFEIVDLQYDSSRKLNTLDKTSYQGNDSDRKSFVYNPVPYNIMFNLYVMVKNAEDGTRILEQIMPFFTPDYTATLRLVPELEITHDVPVVLNRVGVQDLYSGSFQERRSLVWTLQFTMKGFLYGPIRHQHVIKKAIISFEDMNTNSLLSKVTVQPGLTANGEPTSDIMQSIDIGNIKSTDNYGFVVDFEDE